MSPAAPAGSPLSGGRWPSSAPTSIFDRLTDEDARRDVAGPVTGTGTGTVNAFLRRLRSSLKPLRTIVRGDLADTRGRSRTEPGTLGNDSG
jgi:hypothetical protein